MLETYKKSTLAHLCEEYSFKCSKSFGQNFLVDKNIAEKIVTAADVSSADVVEVGAGAGSLTVLLAENARSVLAVELDEKVLPLLEKASDGLSNVRILGADFLALEKKDLPEKFVLVGNLPYQITTPIVARALEVLVGNISSMVFMVQKEVADRLLAAPGGRDFGAISCLVQYTCETERICDVPKTVFVPKPNVDSAVIKLIPKDNSKDDEEIVRLMFSLIHAGFGKRRKTLRNALAAIGFSENALEIAFKAAGVELSRRAETLSPREWYAAAENLKANAN